MKLSFVLLAAACASGPQTSEVESLVSLDTTTGIGFVGKGAVQGLFKWNNAELQTNAAGITFSAEIDAVYEQSCLHTTGNDHMVVHKTFKKSLELSSEVDSTARRNPVDKVTGFLLNGITSSSDVPTDLCNPGNGEPDGVWVPDPAGEYPQITQTSGGTATLVVHFGGQSFPIPLDTDETGD